MRFTPYIALDRFRFDMDREAVVRVLGVPTHEEVNQIGDLELSWDSPALNARLFAGVLTEISADIPVLSFGAGEVRFRELSEFLRSNDPAVFERVGFLVSPRYGLALDPNYPDWVTVFSKGRLSKWDATGR